MLAVKLIELARHHEAQAILYRGLAADDMSAGTPHLDPEPSAERVADGLRLAERGLISGLAWMPHPSDLPGEGLKPALETDVEYVRAALDAVRDLMKAYG